MNPRSSPGRYSIMTPIVVYRFTGYDDYWTFFVSFHFLPSFNSSRWTWKPNTLMKKTLERMRDMVKRSKRARSFPRD